MPEGQDPRTYGDPEGEKATYVEYLLNYRLTLQLKCDGLTPEQLATRSVPPSTMSLLGLVRHMASVEHNWFQRVALATGEDRLYTAPRGPRPRLQRRRRHPGVRRRRVRDARARDRQGRGVAGRRSPSRTSAGPCPSPGREGESVSVRDLLVHMIEEYARHCGHADLLRECVDGRTGQ